MSLPTKVFYLPESAWAELSVRERALLLAAQDCDTLKPKEQGENRGKWIDEYLASCGLKPGHPWCAAFVNSCYRRAGALQGELPHYPASAYNWAMWALQTECKVSEPQRGDLFGWCDKKKWQGHIGFVVRVKKVLGMTFIETIEGNTNEAGSREGTRVLRKRRVVTSKMWFARPEVAR